MSPEALLQEHACANSVQQHERAHQVPEHEIHTATEIPHLHEVHDHPEHHIEVRQAHACTADCPEHSHQEHDHSHSHEQHDTAPPAIQLKAPEHACAADCPEHHHGAHDHHEHATPTAIEQKPHACGVDCPEHANTHQHAAPHEHAHAHAHTVTSTHPKERPADPVPHAHEHQERDHPHTLLLKEHACAADCPEHSHATVSHQTPEHETAAITNTEVQNRIQEAAVITDKIAQEISRTESAQQQQPTPDVPSLHRSVTATITSRTREQSVISDQTQTRETVARVASVSVHEASESSSLAPENLSPVHETGTAEARFEPEPAIGTETMNDSLPALPESGENTEGQLSFPGVVLVEVASGISGDEIDTEQAIENVTPTLAAAPLAHTESIQRALQEDAPITQPATVTEVIEMSALALPALPELPESAPQPESRAIAVAAVATAITERYQTTTSENAAEATVDETQSPAVPPADITHLIHTIQARGVTMPTTENGPAIARPELIQLLQLLGFENPAQTLEQYAQQYGAVFLDDLLAKLFELLQVGRPFEAPQLAQPMLHDDTIWTYALGKTAMLLATMVRQLKPPLTTWPSPIRHVQGGVQ